MNRMRLRPAFVVSPGRPLATTGFIGSDEDGGRVMRRRRPGDGAVTGASPGRHFPVGERHAAVED
jgi:hypothetical protein